MNFKTPLLGVAAAAIALSTATVAASPAQAAIVAGSTLNLSSQANGVSTSLSKIDFFGTVPPVQNVGVDGGEGSFNFGTGFQRLLNLGANNLTARIKDVSLVNGVYTGLLTDFISGINTRPFSPNPFSPNPLNNVSFDLTKFVFNNSTKAADFFGVIRKGNDVSDAIGQFTTQELAGSTSYSMTITAVPTPALLPGLIGLGMGVLRKRKKEMAAAVGAEV
ncbi:MAG: PTPA-CTERM sorting domain-containing protein [Phormidesmis sp. CAN_BIN36]|nr:PTPA-CTERM sorting domain-containing protein [Phormidesmis sp. CAN_BIN36]